MRTYKGEPMIVHLTIPSVGWHRQPVDATSTVDRADAVRVLVNTARKGGK